MFFRKKEGLIYFIAVIIFVILSIILMFKHEPWRDEAQAWLIVRDAPNLSSMIKQMGYEGTPALWHFMLLGLQKAGLPYFSMFVFHFLLALIGVIIFLRYSPFPLFQKVLFIFGYFIFYEYNIIARSYVLTVLFLFLIASVYNDRFTKPVLYSFLLCLLGNSNVHALVIAVCLGIVFIIEVFNEKIKINTRIIVSAVIMIFGFSLAVFQLIPPLDLQPSTASWRSDLSIEHISIIGKAVACAFFPIPQNDVLFWNSTVFRYPYYLYFGIFIYVITLAFFIKKIKALIIYVLLSFCLFSVCFFKSTIFMRHHGLIYIVFIFSLWVSEYYRENKTAQKYASKDLLNIFIGGILFFHIAASLTAFFYEYKHDFSTSKKTAEYLKENNYIRNDVLITAYPSCIATSVLPYLKDKKFYCLEYEKFGSYIIWSKEYFYNSSLNAESIIKRIKKALKTGNFNEVVLILNCVLNKDNKLGGRIKLIESFSNSIVGDESFYIYKLNKGT